MVDGRLIWPWRAVSILGSIVCFYCIRGRWALKGTLLSARIIFSSTRDPSSIASIHTDGMAEDTYSFRTLHLHRIIFRCTSFIIIDLFPFLQMQVKNLLTYYGLKMIVASSSGGLQLTSP